MDEHRLLVLQGAFMQHLRHRGASLWRGNTRSRVRRVEFPAKRHLQSNTWVVTRDSGGQPGVEGPQGKNLRKDKNLPSRVSRLEFVLYLDSSGVIPFNWTLWRQGSYTTKNSFFPGNLQLKEIRRRFFCFFFKPMCLASVMVRSKSHGQVSGFRWLGN